ncbi:MAG: NAD(P)H-hydrate dehydratase [Methylotenera sp.]|jgi:ADP-dependent NAD(P)H-hydrate dehydratase / NAD(P)H-hydrate epimerase
MLKKYGSSFRNTPEKWQSLLPTIDAASNKYTRGHTLVVGGQSLTGASRLSASAAARIGSGVTTLLVPKIAFTVYASALTSIMVKSFDDIETFNQSITNTRITSFLIGPGAGVTDDTRMQSLKLLATSLPVVLDADAITAFQDDVRVLTNYLHANCVLTPHEGEFKRLFNLTEDRMLNAQQAAKDCGAVIVLKGSETIVAAPDGQTIINDNAPPTLATGGSGDVLAGMIAGLIAQGMPAFEASAAAVWMHGEAAKLFGLGLIAEDLPGLLPKVLQKLHMQ